MNTITLSECLLIGVGIGAGIVFAAFCLISYLEQERLAFRRSLIFTLTVPLPYLLAGLIEFPAKTVVSVFLLSVPIITGMIFLIPAKGRPFQDDGKPGRRFDERDIMFSRAALKPGAQRFQEYYRRHPEKRELDDAFRKKPGLLSPKAPFHHRLGFASAVASFQAVDCLKSAVEGAVSNKKVETEPAQMTRYLKHWAIKLGALDVGITALQPYHLYSHRGRREGYGDPVENTHRYALAFTVEMDQGMVVRSPAAPIVMESAQQYLESGKIAVQVAAFIRELGHPARAHIDGNYELICPLVARDAGLGEIGRMGLLMTPRLGPRVRLSVVTTDMPLIPAKKRCDSTMIDFCEHCLKCAQVCPSRAIPFTNQQKIEGAVRWQINSEACFTFWCTGGTDCGRCVRVCPYSHPDTVAHNLIRWGIRNSWIFRRMAVPLDHLFYGRIPLAVDLPEWMKVDSQP